MGDILYNIVRCVCNYSKNTVYMCKCMTCAIVHVCGCAVGMYMYMHTCTSRTMQSISSKLILWQLNNKLQSHCVCAGVV